MELPAPEASGSRPLWRASAAVRCALALLSCALLAALVALVALGPPGGARGGEGGGGGGQPGEAPPALRQWPGGVRLVHKQPGKIMKGGKLEWYADDRMAGVFLDAGFEYNRASHTLKVKSPGLYYIYAQLNAMYFIQGSSEEEGNATLTIHHQTGHSAAPILTLPLHLSSRSNTKSLAAFSAVSSYQLAGGDFLYVTLKMVKDKQHKATQWYFGNHTAFGLSLIPGSFNPEAAGIRRCSPATLEVEWMLKEFCAFFQNDA